LTTRRNGTGSTPKAIEPILQQARDLIADTRRLIADSRQVIVGSATILRKARRVINDSAELQESVAVSIEQSRRTARRIRQTR
jgi:hypothetical protein